MATGILMERKHLDREGAFEVLLLASAESQLELGRVAQLVVAATEEAAASHSRDDDLVVHPQVDGPSPTAITLEDDAAPDRHAVSGL
jgi:hypothetical protein